MANNCTKKIECTVNVILVCGPRELAEKLNLGVSLKHVQQLPLLVDDYTALSGQLSG